MPNILDFGVRQQVLTEIYGAENRDRKAESLKRFEIYMDRSKNYLLEALTNEFSAKTVKEMRTVSSINLCQRIVDEQASIYKNAPTREFSNASENEQEQLDNLYEDAQANIKLKKANKMYKLHRQCAMQVIPKDGSVQLRVLQPHHYDVIPSDNDPEKAEVYIMSVFDKSLVLPAERQSAGFLAKTMDDLSNQLIGDSNDYKAKLASSRFIWWSNEFNFVTDGNGFIIGDNGDRVLQPEAELLLNPIGKLPFVDISYSKDFEFFIRGGSSSVQFNLDFQLLLSDIATINRMQGYSQAIIYSESLPENMVIGPNNVLHIPQDPNKELQPRFEFASPSPDLNASLQLMNEMVSLYLTSNGIDPKIVSGKADANKFSSGLERLLAMIEKFEASKDDIDLFKMVEQKVFDLMTDWSNLFQGVNIANGKNIPLKEDLQVATIPDTVSLNINFAKPEAIQTKVEMEDSIIKLLDNGLISKTKAIMDLNGVDEDKAKEMLVDIDSEMLANVKTPAEAVPVGQGTEG